MVCMSLFMESWNGILSKLIKCTFYGRGVLLGYIFFLKIIPGAFSTSFMMVRYKYSIVMCLFIVTDTAAGERMVTSECITLINTTLTTNLNTKSTRHYAVYYYYSIKTGITHYKFLDYYIKFCIKC